MEKSVKFKHLSNFLQEERTLLKSAFYNRIEKKKVLSVVKASNKLLLYNIECSCTYKSV